MGTANLFGVVDPTQSQRLLEQAWDVGFRRFDTAPSYGFGRSEPAVGRLLARRRDGDTLVTTKVGIAAVPPPGRLTRTAKAVARGLPASVQARLRPDRPPQQGRFDPAEVRTGVEASLRGLGRIDRLMLHEVRPDEITDDLLGLLERWVRDGDVGQAGVATATEVTAACLARGAGVLRAVHVAAGLFAPPITLPPEVAARVGHGALGAGGQDLARVRTRIANDPELLARWRRASGAGGDDTFGLLGDALVARAGGRPDLTDLIIATAHGQRLGRAVEVLTGTRPVAPDLVGVLDSMAAGGA